MKKLINKIKEFIIKFKNIISITFLVNFLIFVISTYYMNDILNMLDKNLIFKNYLIFILSSLASSFLISLIIIAVLFFTYLTKKLFKINKNYIIYFIFFPFNFLVIIYSIVDFKLFSVMGIHISNNFILSNIFNFEMLKHDTKFDNLILIHLFLLVFFIFIISLIVYKFIFFKKSKFSKLLNYSYLFLSILSILLSMIFFISFNNINLFFISFKILNYKNDIPTNFNIEYRNVHSIKLNNKPNIIFIVSESLRKDIINENNSPNIYNFMKNNDIIDVKYSYSGAHFTLKSIFSILYSMYGYNMDFLFNKETSNSNNLYIMKEYHKIFLTASDIRYTKGEKILSDFQESQYFDYDSNLIKKFKNKYAELQKTNSPYFFFLFFNNTHYQYFFNPKKAKYKPYSKKEEIKHIMSSMDRSNKEKIFNRYRNSVLNLDNNFKKVIDTLSEKDKKEAIIVFTGDHGEQFWEHGLYGHVGKKTYFKENILVPFFIRIPGFRKTVFLASHLDIFPTILDYISDISNKQIKEIFQGKSLLNQNIENDRYFIVSTIDGVLGLGNLYLVNKYGKAVIRSLSNELVKNNKFKAVKYLTHDDETIKDKSIIKKLNEDIEDFSKNQHKRYIKLKKE